MKVLLAIDGSACSDSAVTEVASRPWPVGTEFRVLSAYELPMVPTPEAWAISPEYYDAIEDAARAHAQSAVEAGRLKLTDKFGDSCVTTTAIVPGSAKSVILDHAEAWGADLIVVGSHGYGAWERLLLGSVSQAVVSHAKCSVEVVRCRAQQKHNTVAA